MPSGISLLALLFHLAMATAGLFFLGFLVSFRAKEVVWPWRVLLGLLVGFYWVGIASLLGWRAEWGLWAMVIAGVGLGARVLRRDGRLPPRRLWVFPILPILLLACIAVRAYWPVVVPLSTDPAQHYWFIHQILRFGGVPSDPLNYPAGTGIVGFLVATLAGGLSVVDFGAILPLLFVLLLAATLACSARSPIQALWRFLACLSVGWAVKHPGSYQEGYGRMILLPILFLVLFQPFEKYRAPPSGFLWAVLALGVPLLISLNPAVAPVSLFGCGAVAAWLVGREPRGLRWAGPLLLAACWVTLASDPYFNAWLRGETAVNPTFTAAALPWSWQPIHGLRSFFAAYGFGIFGSAFASGFLLLPLLLAAFSFHGSRRAGGVWIIGYGVIWVTLTALVTGGAGSLSLIRQYGLQLLPFLAAFLAMVLWADVFALAFPSRQARARFALFLVLFLCWADRPLREVRALWRRGAFTRPELPISLVEMLGQAQTIWAADPRARILLENWNPQIHGEDWIFVPLELACLAYLPNANPAFFFFRGDARYTARNYAERVCPHRDKKWLAELGGTHVALTPGESPCFVGAKDPQRFRLLSLDAL